MTLVFTPCLAQVFIHYLAITYIHPFHSCILYLIDPMQLDSFILQFLVIRSIHLVVLMVNLYSAKCVLLRRFKINPSKQCKWILIITHSFLLSSYLQFIILPIYWLLMGSASAINDRHFTFVGLFRLPQNSLRPSVYSPHLCSHRVREI